VSSEELQSGDPEPLERLTDFVELPFDERWLERPGALEDRPRQRDREPVDPLWVERHPATVELARQLGYEASPMGVESSLVRVSSS
jgi:hypothetical protein